MFPRREYGRQGRSVESGVEGEGAQCLGRSVEEAVDSAALEHSIQRQEADRVGQNGSRNVQQRVRMGGARENGRKV